MALVHVALTIPGEIPVVYAVHRVERHFVRAAIHRAYDRGGMKAVRHFLASDRRVVAAK